MTVRTLDEPMAAKAPKPADAADALAIAITHAWRGTGLLGAP